MDAMLDMSRAVSARLQVCFACKVLLCASKMLQNLWPSISIVARHNHDVVMQILSFQYVAGC